MFKVPNGQDPYSAIGKYIRDHITAIEDIIAVIKINDAETNQLFMVDINEENYFIWENDWWEGEEDITLIDFFPVSEAQCANQNAQSADTISRQDAIDEIREWKSRMTTDGMIDRIKALPSAQPEIIRCKDCKWHKKEIGWNRIEYMVCDKSVINKPIRNDDDFCSRAERRTDE